MRLTIRLTCRKSGKAQGLAQSSEHAGGKAEGYVVVGLGRSLAVVVKPEKAY